MLGLVPRLVVRWPWTERGGAVHLLAGLPWSLSRSRVRCAPRRQGARLYDQARPATPLLDSSAHTRAQKETPSSALDPDAPRAQQSVHGRPPRQCGHRGRGALVVGAEPWARIAPGVDHGEGRPPKARARRPLDGPGAHRVGDLGSSSLRGRTDHGRQVVADAAHRHAPGRITPMDHQRPARPGRRCPLSPPAAARGQPARPLGATGPEGPHLRINGPWPLPLRRAGTRRRSLPAPPTTPDDRSAQRQTRGPGPLFERSGQQATGPARIDPLEQTVQHPKRTQLPYHTRPPTRTITLTALTY